MTQMLQVSDKEFNITVINMVKGFMKESRQYECSVEEFSRNMEMMRKCRVDMLLIK